jgi:hypothetical protein
MEMAVTAHGLRTAVALPWVALAKSSGASAPWLVLEGPAPAAESQAVYASRADARPRRAPVAELQRAAVDQASVLVVSI